ILVFIPFACLVAARGVWLTFRWIGKHTVIGAAIAVFAVFSYQLYTTVTEEILYPKDIRVDVGRWLAQNVPSGSAISTFTIYSQVNGARLISTKPVEPYFLTCDHEYSRYFTNSDANKIFHAFGGQERLDFYRDLFSG